MTENIPASSVAEIDPTGAQKVALLLLSLPRERAERLLGKFNQTELDRLRKATAAMPSIDAALLSNLVNEFEHELAHSIDFLGSPDEFDSLLSSLTDDPEEAASQDNAITLEPDLWQEVEQLDEDVLVSYLASEQPQTVAYILAQTGAEFSARILPLLDTGMRTQVVMRLMRQSPVGPKAAEAVERAIRASLLVQSQGDLSQEHRQKTANIMNRIDDHVRQELLETLFQSDPDEARALKSLLFGFEDLGKLDDAGRALLFDKVAADAIITALSGAEENMQQMVLGALSARNKRMVEAELKSGAAPPEDDIRKARQQIAAQALNLIQQGAIAIPEADQDV